MKRVEGASGARYSSHKEQARKFEPIAPVGTNYTPVGKVDIGALRKAPNPGGSSTGTIATKPAIPSAPRPNFGGTTGSSSSYNNPTIGKAPAGAWEDEPAPPPPPPPAASRPPAITSNRPTVAVSTSSRLCTIILNFFDYTSPYRVLFLLPLQQCRRLQFLLNRQKTIELHQ